MTGYPTRPEDDYYPVPVIPETDPPTYDPDRYLLGPTADGIAAVLGMGLVVLTFLYLFAQVVRMLFILF